MPITNSQKIRNLRKSLRLSKRQKKILIGSLLGDGCLIPNSWNKNYRFQVEQNELHKNYVFWLYEEFRDWVLTKPKYHSQVKSWKFRTISHPELTELAKNFYSKRIKILPTNIKAVLNDPFILAIWFMDDGCLAPRKDGFIFNTQSFTKEENEKLRKCLEENFYLKQISIHRDKKKFRLYVRSKSLPRLYGLVQKYILPEFTYKLPIAP